MKRLDTPKVWLESGFAVFSQETPLQVIPPEQVIEAELKCSVASEFGCRSGFARFHWIAHPNLPVEVILIESDLGKIFHLYHIKAHPTTTALLFTDGMCALSFLFASCVFVVHCERERIC